MLVDSNVIFDLLSDDAEWFDWSVDAIESVAQRARLIVNPVIFAEVSIRYSRVEDVDAALPQDMFDREPLPYEAAFVAGKAFLAYRRRGGTKRMVLPDFFVGAHAAVAGYDLLTRDPARYRTYFPKLGLIAPE
ncbi:MAG TPA: type II toxin-antitoxin system VapC family toxin [Stellaceae bacterium]